MSQIQRVLNVPKFAASKVPKMRMANSTNLPTKFDLNDLYKFPVLDQASIGACVSFATLSAINYLDSTFSGSHLFLYWNARNLQNNAASDSGTVPTDAVKAATEFGVCSELTWQYDTNKFAQKPVEECYKQALDHQVLVAAEVQNDVDSIKCALVNKFPVIFCLDIFPNFQSIEVQQTGKIPMPIQNDKSQGGHCCCFVGFDDDQKHFICLNSWGKTWGKNGQFYLPYEYIGEHTWNEYIIKSIEKPTLINPTSNPGPAAPVSAPVVSQAKTIEVQDYFYSIDYDSAKKSMMIVVKPKMPVDYMNILFTVPKQTAQKIGMTYRDLYYRYLITNVANKDQADKTTIKFVYAVQKSGKETIGCT